MKKFILKFDKILAVFYTLLVGIASLIPPSTIKNVEWMYGWLSDKWIHVIMYTVLGFLWALALRKSKYPFFLPMIIVISFGIIVELFQFQFILGRYFEMFDIIANITGCIIGIGLFYLFINKAKE